MGIAPKIVPPAPNTAPKQVIEPQDAFAGGTPPAPRKLSSWKEIAAYLNRDVRTVQRWEKSEKLPVRRLRHAQRGSVFAYARELDSWVVARSSPPFTEQIDHRLARSHRFRNPRTASAVLALFSIAALILIPRFRQGPLSPHTPANAGVSAVAREAYMRGSYYFHRGTFEDVSASTKYFQRAIDAAPNYSAAYAALSVTRLMLRASSGNAAAEIAHSRELAQQAVSLDPALAEAHDALGMALAYGDWDWTSAEKEFLRALELNPGLAQAHSDYSQLEALFGRENLAIAEARRARELEPLSATIQSNLSWDYYWAHRFDDAIAISREMLASEPAYLIARSCIIRSLLVQGKFSEAHHEVVADLLAHGQDPAAYGLNDPSPETALRSYLEKSLAEQRALYEQKKIGPFLIAIDLAALHRKDELLDCLQRAVARREGISLVMNVEPLFDPYRHDPRFISIMRSTGLPSPAGSASLTQLREQPRAKFSGSPEAAARVN